MHLKDYINNAKTMQPDDAGSPEEFEKLIISMTDSKAKKEAERYYDIICKDIAKKVNSCQLPVKGCIIVSDFETETGFDTYSEQMFRKYSPDTIHCVFKKLGFTHHNGAEDNVWDYSITLHRRITTVNKGLLHYTYYATLTTSFYWDLFKQAITKKIENEGIELCIYALGKQDDPSKYELNRAYKVDSLHTGPEKIILEYSYTC